MQYGNLLKRAWNIIWRNKIMWVFGFLAALGSGSGGGGGGGGGGGSSGPSGNFPGPEGGPGLSPDVERALNALIQNQTFVLTIIAIVVGVALLIAVIMALLSALGHSALVEMARQADETDKTSFGAGWGAGRRKMLPVFAVRFLIGLLPALIVLASLVPFFVSLIAFISQVSVERTPGPALVGLVASALACVIPAGCLAWAMSVVLDVVGQLAIRALVLEEHGVLNSIRRGWNILTRNLGEVVILWLIFLVVHLVLTVVLGVAFLVIMLAMAVPIVVAVIMTPVVGLIGAMLAILFIIALGAVVRGPIEAYISTVWTLAYRQWMAGPAPAPVQAVA